MLLIVVHYKMIKKYESSLPLSWKVCSVPSPAVLKTIFNNPFALFAQSILVWDCLQKSFCSIILSGAWFILIFMFKYVKYLLTACFLFCGTIWDHIPATTVAGKYALTILQDCPRCSSFYGRISTWNQHHLYKHRWISSTQMTRYKPVWHEQQVQFGTTYGHYAHLDHKIIAECCHRLDPINKTILSSIHWNPMKTFQWYTAWRI